MAFKPKRHLKVINNLKDLDLNASDLIHDCSCSLCKDDYHNTEAKYFCGDCSKYYCDKCLTFHAKVHKEHIVLGRKDVNKWSGKGDAIYMCDLHPSKVMELHCDDHDELCCHLCVSLNHRMCRSITLISDLARGNNQPDPGERRQKEKKQNSLKASGKSMLTKVKALRTSLNQLLDELEKRTVEEIDSVLADLDGSLQKDIDACTNIHDQLKALLDTVQAKDDDSESTFYIGYRKCQDKMTEANRLLQDMSTKQKMTVIFQPSTNALQLLSDLKTLGHMKGNAEINGQHNLFGMQSSGQVNPLLDISKVFKMKAKKKINVKLKSDKEYCHITGITVLSRGEIILVDYVSRKAKMLDSNYKVTAHCDLPKYTHALCSISDQKVAVTVNCGGDTVRHEVHFLTVSAGTIKMTRKFSVDHGCYSISHHGGVLYVGSATALYLYTTAGRLVRKIHEDNSDNSTVNQFAFSTDGRKIFIPASGQNKIVTMDTQGNILSTLRDTSFNWPCCVHVSESGHVFVCSSDSHTVVQFDEEGKKKMTTLIREGDGINHPRTIWYNPRTGRLIVGGNQDDILVVELQ
ncbi:uncharacterized protein LOC128229690 [Mya arenaria]|uniref:uncharacterized protein LOC128229690 n=1 Tax=Mya arenaria TaxID=6604 RepID=UPI0022E829A1|nr:uncharacterized protein LOC128229690 [Mya arenaria]